MIILDEEDQRKHFNDPYGGLTLRYPEKAVARSDSPLPDYETSEARQKHQDQRSKVDPTLWRAVSIALGIYVLLSVIIGVPIILIKRNQERDQDSRPAPPWPYGGADSAVTLNLANPHFGVPKDPTPCDWSLIETNPFQPLSSNVTRNIDYSGSGAFYIRSNITRTYPAGHLTVDVNPDPEVSTTVFRLEASASSQELLQDITACFDNSGPDIGLFFSVARELQPTDSMTMNIQVLFPKSGLQQPGEFITYLPWFSHTFGDLAPYTTFGRVFVEGAGYPIIVKSLKAFNIGIVNAYASIIGTYHVIGGLTLDGIKGNITANVTLEQNLHGMTPTYLSMATGDGSIDSLVTLVASAPQNVTHPHSPYTFVANVETYNAPLNLTVVYPSFTHPTPLQLNVKNNNGNTNLVLDENYQGTFSAQNQLNTVNVQPVAVPSSSDPMNLGRSRLVEYELVSPTFSRGWAGWGSPMQGVIESQVKISSSLSPVVLQL